MHSLKRLVLFSVFALAAAAPMAGAQVVRPEDCLPPKDSAYVGQFHQKYPIGYLLTNPVHYRFTHCDPPPAPGGVTIHVFDSVVQATVTTPGGDKIFAFGQAHCSVRVQFRNQGGPNRLFDTEMLQLDISGGNLPQNVLIRESPERPSKGMTKITKLGGGNYRIQSFFDIFTELSLNGGQTWSAALEPGHMVVADQAIAKLKLIPPKVKGGKKFKLQVTLKLPAPVGGAVVNLTNSNSAANVPATITVAQGEKVATIVVDTTPVTAITTGVVTATLGPSSKSANLTVTP